jgi:hypothetical protein
MEMAPDPLSALSAGRGDDDDGIGSRVSQNPCRHRLTAPDAVLAISDLHLPRSDVWLTDFFADAH